MKLLILGGTIFLGRHLVEIARAHGHEITIFNRGQHNTELFQDVEKLRGDRDGGLDALKGGRWDAVIDTCGYVPRIVRDSAELLFRAVDHYTFVSSISVYADVSEPGLDEDAAVGKLEDESIEEVTGQTYGPLKALCEQAAAAAMPGRVLNVRPGLIVGPHDPTDRFTYWPHRLDRGGEVLAPEPPGAPVQVIDVRDLAEWTIEMVERRETGIYNATGPAYQLTMGEVLETSREAGGDDASLKWLSPRFLKAAEIEPWIDLPLWLPDEATAGMLAVNVDKAIGAGLKFRPLSQTVGDTLAWAKERPVDHEWRAGLKPEKEEEVLAAWHALRSNGH
jgi:2'-hydroxyisoflavone reductase